MAATTKERQIIVYPKPYYYAMFKAYITICNNMTSSKAGGEAIKSLIENLPPEKKQQVIAAYNRAKQTSKNTY